ncbi:MAG: fumarylacetoacetate hydrolase family protein [Ardenticatenaceae bacterium]|nr:fumarylacetoacetate hydrolase family protein [Ardenticatenaceae bacterium]
MKLITYQHNDRTRIGVVVDEAVVDLTAVSPTLLSLIKQGPAGLQRAKAAIDTAKPTIPLAEVELLAPIPMPDRNVMCLGWNYAEHAKESAETKGLQIKELPQYPIIFTKATTSVNGPFGDVPWSTAVSTEFDYEVELAVIIGKQGINIPREQAIGYVYGYTVLNDISARDLQRNGKQFFKGKSLDGTCPIGPWLVTADEIPDPHNLAITCRVNGVTKQDSSTRHMIFDISATIAYLSLGMTLLPGDIIATGTPSGVGFARTPPEYLQPGDVVESEIEGIGLIRNKIKAM